MIPRRLYAAAVTAAVIGTTAGGFVYLRGGSTPVTIGESVSRYRDGKQAPKAPAIASRANSRATRSATSQASSTRRVRETTGVTGTKGTARARSRPVPPEGVYRYATSGYDEVTALGGSRHTYPRETTITVRHAGCGLVERWDALEERWDERESCRSSRGDRLLRVTSYHEFFRRGDHRTLRCDGLTYPTGARPGDTWTMRCDSDTTKSVSTLRAVGYEDVAVDGKAIRTLHVRVDIRVSGEQQGAGRRDVWGAQSSGLVVRERSSLRTDSVQPAIGRVTYHEEYELRLSSLTPVR